MVFVPRQPLTWDLVAPAQSLPRAVPMDALVSLVTQLVPGWLVQRLALAGAIFLAAVGAGRLVPTDRRAVRLFAALAYAWTPYLAERLLIGQWGLLLAYAALPWLVRAALDLRAGRDGALARVVLAAAPAAITPTGGLIALGTVLVLTSDRMRAPVAAGVGADASAPVPAGVGRGRSAQRPLGGRRPGHRRRGSSDPAGVAAFAARSENWAGPLVALAGTGGIWSAQATPASRAAPLVPVATLVLLVLAGVGAGLLRRRLPPGGRHAWRCSPGPVVCSPPSGCFPAGTPRCAGRWCTCRARGCCAMGRSSWPVRAAACGVRSVGGRAAGGPGRPGGGRRGPGRALLFLPVAVLPDLAFGGAVGFGR